MHVDTLRGNRDVSQMPYNSAHSPMLTRTDHISSLDHRTRLFIRRCATICFFLFGMIILEGAEVVTPQKSEGGNASNATTKPVAQARSLAMLSQVVIQLEDYVQSKDLSAIHNEDVILSAAASELLTQADTIASNQSADFKTSLTTFCSRVSALHLVADLNQQANAETELDKVQESFSKVKAHFSKEVIASAQVYLETFTCPMHRDVVGKRTDFCPKCGMPLDQLCRILPNSGFPVPGQQTVRASISTTGPLTVGKPAAVLLHLQRSNGDPVSPADLIETHTKKIHLFIVDSSLTDYHHEHPVPTGNPGEYSFSFTPAKPGGYRVWADVRPNPLGLQEYAITDIPSTTEGEPLTNRAVNFKTSVDALSYELIFPQKTIRVGQPTTFRLRITSADGKGFTQLEPLMATFAHLVGFNQDYKTVMHMHPRGAPILDPTARGGPDLEFQFYPLKPGFVRLFAQVQIEGRSHFAPFGLQIVP
jgi:Heavy metal binding domain